MDETLDIRPYIWGVWNHKRWIFGGSALLALIAFGVSLAIPSMYEATALIVSTQPRQVIQFDPRIEATSDDLPPLQAYPEIATSDELMSDLLKEIEPARSNISTLNELRDLLEVRTGQDPSVFHLVVRHEDPREAANLANIWAARFVEEANEIYGDQGGQQLVFFEAQLTTAQEDLARAEEALSSFQRSNRESLLLNRLTTQRETHARYLEDKQRLEMLAQDVESLLQQVNNGEGILTAAEQLSSLLLQIETYNAEIETLLQFQVDTNSAISELNRSDQLAILDTLSSILVSRISESDARVQEREPQVLTLQEAYQRAQAEHQELQRNLGVATETYLALARKVEEERITAQDESSGLRLASRAAVPTEIAGLSSFVWLFLCAAVSVMVGVLSSFAATWWRIENSSD